MRIGLVDSMPFSSVTIANSETTPTLEVSNSNNFILPSSRRTWHDHREKRNSRLNNRSPLPVKFICR